MITARDLIGEQPVSLLRERGGRFDLAVADLRVPRERIDARDIEARHARRNLTHHCGA